jgi:hypothetical protein
MSSDGEYIRGGAKEDLVLSKIRLDRAVEAYTKSQSVGPDQRLIATEGLHSATLGLWWRMRPHIKGRPEWDSAEESELIEGATIWEGRHPQSGDSVTIAGLADLEEWIDRSVEIERAAGGPNHASNTHTEEVQVRLPAAAALDSAEVLADLFDELGWAPEADQLHKEADSDYSDILENGA